MNPKKWSLVGLIAVMLIVYDQAQPDLLRMRTMEITDQTPPEVAKKLKRECYGPSLRWLDRLMNARNDQNAVKLDFTVLSSMMIAGLASGFRGQVANLLWMKSDEYWHQGMSTRQVPLMEAVVTLDPEFIDAWSTAGWHWAYNIFADIELNPLYKGKKDARTLKTVRRLQDHAVTIGMDYLRRGAEMNPETYRLWFEYAWHRGAKQGIVDEKTIELLNMARRQPDARQVIEDVMVNGHMEHRTTQGIDLVGRTIGHTYEIIPIIDKALDHYANDLLKATPQERALLDAVGDYWHRYSTDYSVIGQVYTQSPPAVQAQIRALVPDVQHLVEADAMRQKMAKRDNQPTGAYITIAARYMPSWKLFRAGKTPEAIDNIIGVMNADPKYHLTQLPVLAKVMAIRGDAPSAIQARLQEVRKIEKSSGQEIGLHLLARMYGRAATQTKDPKLRTNYNHLAYETWYRSRERSQLDYYARHNAQLYEDNFGFQPPQKIIAAVKAARKRGDVFAAPELPPNVQQYYGEEPLAPGVDRPELHELPAALK